MLNVPKLVACLHFLFKVYLLFYFVGRKADEEGNTLFHHCAMSSHGDTGINLINIAKRRGMLQNPALKKKNKQGDTMLHIAFYKGMIFSVI